MCYNYNSSNKTNSFLNISTHVVEKALDVWAKSAKKWEMDNRLSAMLDCINNHCWELSFSIKKGFPWFTYYKINEDAMKLYNMAKADLAKPDATWSHAFVSCYAFLTTIKNILKENNSLDWKAEYDFERIEPNYWGSNSPYVKKCSTYQYAIDVAKKFGITVIPMQLEDIQYFKINEYIK